MEDMHYNRIAVKLSGELMLGDLDFGVDIERMRGYADDLIEIARSGVEVLVEVGGGNIYRWRTAQEGVSRTTGDTMGMLGSVMTALNLRDVIAERHDVVAMSQVYAPYVIDHYTPEKARKHLSEKRIVICGGGTGQQFFTTDSGAALHALQTECDVLLKGTNVDGVYSSDPNLDPDAVRFDTLSFTEVLDKNLQVMDMTAFALMRDNNVPVLVFDVREPGSIQEALEDHSKGTLVTN